MDLALHQHEDLGLQLLALLLEELRQQVVQLRLLLRVDQLRDRVGKLLPRHCELELLDLGVELRRLSGLRELLYHGVHFLGLPLLQGLLVLCELGALLAPQSELALQL